MAYQTFRQEYLQVPPVTRAYTTACVLTTAAVVSAAAAGPPQGPAPLRARLGQRWLGGAPGRLPAACRGAGERGGSAEHARQRRGGALGPRRRGGESEEGVSQTQAAPGVLVAAPRGVLSGGGGVESALAGLPPPASRGSRRGQSTGR